MAQFYLISFHENEDETLEVARGFVLVFVEGNQIKLGHVDVEKLEFELLDAGTWENISVQQKFTVADLNVSMEHVFNLVETLKANHQNIISTEQAAAIQAAIQFHQASYNLSTPLSNFSNFPAPHATGNSYLSNLLLQNVITYSCLVFSYPFRNEW